MDMTTTDYRTTLRTDVTCREMATNKNRGMDARRIAVLRCFFRVAATHRLVRRTDLG